MTRRKRKDGGTSTVLIVLLKNPILGRAKTRIAKKVGEQKALEIYEELILVNQKLVSSVAIPSAVFYSDFIDSLDVFVNVQDKVLQLQSEDLGDRIRDAFQTCFKAYDQGIIIGSDCPDISSSHIESAIDKLNHADVVVGPSSDGGFYLLGLSSIHDHLFDEIEWSSSSVVEQLHKNCETLKLKTDELEVLTDIDEIEDWQRYNARMYDAD